MKLDLSKLKQSKFLDKRIPTILGLLVLVVALVAGTLLIGSGPGVFAPRATPETTPSKIKITNITDNSFTVSFITAEQTAGFVKYGVSENSLRNQAGDDRDQLSGNVGSYTTHHVSVRGLEQNTTYYFVLGTGSGNTFDNSGSPFTVTTAQRSGAPSAAKTVYGSVTNPNGGPANGAIVYISLDGAGEMSSLVKNSGSWATPLSNARTPDGSAYAQIGDDDTLSILVQGTTPELTSLLSSVVSESQPVPTIVLGQNEPVEAPSRAESETEEEPESQVEDEAETREQTDLSEDEASTESATQDEIDKRMGDFMGGTGTQNRTTSQDDSDQTNLAEQVQVSESERTLDLGEGEDQVVKSSTPIIRGEAIPNATVTIIINSDHQITQTVTSDSSGQFSLDLSEIEESLEPGDHTISYTYIDPNTNQEVSQTLAFQVADNSQPFGSGNPFPATSASPSPSPTPSVSPSPTPTPASASASPDVGGMDGTRSAQPATDAAVPQSGSVEMTLILVVGGLFFIISGLWSYWIANQIKDSEVSL